MPEEYALPVEGYQPSVDPMGYALPVAQPIDNSRIYISPKPEVIPTREEPILHSSGKQLKAVDHDPWANLGMAGVEDKSGQSEHPLLKQLFGLGGEPRVQLWPERMVRAGVTAAGNVMSGQTPQWAVDPETGDVHTSPQMIEAGLDTAALAGTGGLAGTTEATLGSGPFLRPALKHNGKIYKGKEGQQHLDVLPKELQADFNQKALSGEDISHYNFGFMNHKGQFLNREAALDYAVKEGLVDPTAGQYGALTSTLLSDSSKPGIAIEAMKKPTFYSALEHNVNNISQAKMTGDQWLGTLANKPGVKPEELQWTGLKDFLEENKGKPVTKEQVIEHLEQNKVELKEVTKGELSDKDILAQSKIRQEDWDKMSQSQKEVIRTNFPTEKTKYHSYQLTGGENYREMLMTLPKKPKLTADGLPHDYKLIDENAATRASGYDIPAGTPERWSYSGPGISSQVFKTREDAIISALRNAKQNDHDGSYKSSHWDEPNILAHVRMNDRTIEGKKSLHLEEIQSDWHQQGREKGYKNPEEYQAKQNELKKQLQDIQAERAKLVGSKNPDDAQRYTELHNKESAITDQYNALHDAQQYGVPDAPFKKTWHELALKRMLREAAEKGYDRLSWTPGEAQAARYDLSKTFNEINANPSVHNGQPSKTWWPKAKNGTSYDSIITDNEGKILQAGQTWGDIKGKNISDVVGKDIAERGLKEGQQKLTGVDLKIGGEGMKGFYDKMIPNALEKMGKEHGVKVKQTNLPELTKFGNKIGEAPIEQSVHYIDIPQSLKDTVLRKGQPLFSSAHPGVTFSQTDHDPWEKKNAAKEK